MCADAFMLPLARRGAFKVIKSEQVENQLIRLAQGRHHEHKVRGFLNTPCAVAVQREIMHCRQFFTRK